MAGVLSLPAEILEKVASATVLATAYRPADQLESQDTLYRLCLTSRWFCQALTPQLYRHVVLSRYLDSTYSASITVASYNSDYDCAADRLVLFMRTLLESPRHRAMVWKLDCHLYLKDIPPLYRLISWAQNGVEILRSFVSGRYDEPAAVLCLAHGLQTLIIRSAPVPLFQPAKPNLKNTMCYDLNSDLISSALDMPQLRPFTQPKLTSFTVALEPCAELRHDHIERRRHIYTPSFYEIFVDICLGILRAPNLADLEIIGETYARSGDKGWADVTSMMDNKITRIFASGFGLVRMIAWKPRGITEIVLDSGPASAAYTYFDPKDLDAAFLHLRDTLETLDFAASLTPAPMYDSEDEDEWTRQVCWPRMTKLKHLRVTIQMLVGEPCGPKENIIANEHKDPIAGPTTDSPWEWANSDEQLSGRIKRLVVFARTCSITHPKLRRVYFGDTGLAEVKIIRPRANRGCLGDVEPPPILWGRWEDYDTHKEFRDKWRPRLRDLFAQSGVSFSWVAADAVYYR
ncbi:hypothetical protein B0T22DRAFT_516041 [Podospora appendiculata]|uniref:Uncharacterized protein n=1 Tax=Podospora appendiculata TaxID=314037 RepID=A0AAE0XDK5_9PEZI|nr:hypothetical protein B0T22DRAFT_516041 [Podospora appendiculata]